MKIDHIAIWVENMEKMKGFYMRYFNMACSDKYINDKKNFSSYFLSFNGGSRIEIMHRPDIDRSSSQITESIGLAHISISVGSKKEVDLLTELIHDDGYIITGQPRITGDGYYESVISDPEGNIVEITE